MTTHLRRAALLLSIFLLLMPAGSRADDGETISNGTAALPEGLEDFAWRLTDGDENSRVHIPAEQTLTLRPEDKAAALLLVSGTRRRKAFRSHSSQRAGMRSKPSRRAARWKRLCR